MEPPPSVSRQKIRTDPSLLVIKTGEEYTPDLKALEARWYQPQDALKRKWYTSTYSKEQQKEFGRLWIADMKRLRCDIEFFRWFELTGRMENQNESLNVIINKWYTQSNKIIESVTPPLEGIKIPHSNEVLNASPFNIQERIKKLTNLFKLQ